MTATPLPWRTVATETVVADRWIHVRADDCIDARGRRIAPYYVLEYGDWVSVLAVDTEGRALLAEEYRHGAGVVALGTVGGGAESGEDPRAAAVRELREETGYEAAELHELGATWANFGSHTNRVHHYLALGCTRVGEPSLDDTEMIALHRVPLADAGRRLTQSYHLLTWYKAQELLRS